MDLNNFQFKQRQLAKKDNSFVARVYFGNLTYTSVLLPMNSTAENVIGVVKKKFNITEDSELYGIHVYYPQTGCKFKSCPFPSFT
jgi:hypothetical protein